MKYTLRCTFSRNCLTICPSSDQSTVIADRSSPLSTNWIFRSYDEFVCDICIINIWDIYSRTEHATRGLTVKWQHMPYFKCEINLMSREARTYCVCKNIQQITYWIEAADKDVETRKHFQNYTQWRLKCAKKYGALWIHQVLVDERTKVPLKQPFPLARNTSR